MFNGIELEVMLYDDYMDMVMDERDDMDDYDSEEDAALAKLLNGSEGVSDTSKFLTKISSMKATFFDFNFVGEFSEHPTYSLISSGGMTFICKMTYPEVKKIIAVYRTSSIN